MWRSQIVQNVRNLVFLAPNFSTEILIITFSFYLSVHVVEGILRTSA